MSRKQFTQFILRLSPDLHQEIAAAAARSRRSLNSEIVHRLERPERSIEIIEAVINEEAERLQNLLGMTLARIAELKTVTAEMDEATEKMESAQRQYQAALRVSQK